MKKILLCSALISLLSFGSAQAGASTSMEDLIDISEMEIVPDRSDLAWRLVSNMRFGKNATFESFPVASIDVCKTLGRGMMSQIYRLYPHSKVFCINTSTGEMITLTSPD